MKSRSLLVKEWDALKITINLIYCVASQCRKIFQEEYIRWEYSFEIVGRENDRLD
jgi:hypothetical protein